MLLLLVLICYKYSYVDVTTIMFVSSDVNVTDLLGVSLVSFWTL